MGRALGVAAAWGCLAVLSVPASMTRAGEAGVKLKAATMAPVGSTWQRGVEKIAARWSQESAGKVKLVVYPGGVQGDEGDCIRKMRINQLQACAITGFSLGDITAEPLALSVPLMISSYPELDYVMARVHERFERAVAAKGFIILAWTDAGTLHFFSKRPAATPEQAFAQKVMAPSGNPKMTEAWRHAGFSPVVLSSTDALPGLQTGMIDAVVTVPMVALSLDWYSGAPNMTQVPLGTLVGALVVTQRAWEAVPAELRPRLLEIARQEGESMRPTARGEDQQAVAAMEQKRLRVVTPNPEQRRQWEALSDKLFPAMRGSVVPAEAFDAVKAARDEYRAQHPPAETTGAGAGGPAR